MSDPYYLGKCGCCGRKRLAYTIDDSVGKAINHKDYCDFNNGVAIQFDCNRISPLRALVYLLFRV